MGSYPLSTTRSSIGMMALSVIVPRLRPGVRVHEAWSGLVGGDSGNVERQVRDLVLGEGRTEA